MKNILNELKTSLLVTLVTTVILCGFYPLLIWGGGQLLFPSQANGSLVTGKDGETYGSSLLGQNFGGAEYFQSRPSAAGANGYDGSASGGSNLGPTSQKLADAIKARVKQYRLDNHLADSAPVPADAVTASGSGLDPHISVKNALLQLPRVAKARGLDGERVRLLLEKYIDRPGLHVFGEAGVNVMELNLALDGKL